MARRSSGKKILLLIAATLCVVIVAYLLYKNFGSGQLAKTTSQSETAQNDYKTGDERKAASSSGNSQGGATDNDGQLPEGAVPDASKAKSSASGDISVTTPYENSTMNDGALIAGSAKMPKVQYRLVDDSVGVIAQGELSVVNGQFSGTLHFKAHSNKGQLEVFNIDPQTGAETNRVELGVLF